MLAAMSAGDPRRLLEQRLKGMDTRRSVLAALFLAVAALVIGLYVAQGRMGAATRVVVIAFVIAGCFVAYGLWLIYQVATGPSRRQRFFEILDREPDRVARIYGAGLIRTTKAAVVVPIDESRANERRNLYVVVELVEPSRLRRLAGLQKLVVKVGTDEFQPLLAYLRGLAPEAQGRP
jgi:hypothetical protein